MEYESLGKASIKKFPSSSVILAFTNLTADSPTSGVLDTITLTNEMACCFSSFTFPLIVNSCAINTTGNKNKKSAPFNLIKNVEYSSQNI